MKAGLGCALLLLAAPAVGRAQEYLIRLDARVQSVSYRGVQKDSILANQVVTGPMAALRLRTATLPACTGLTYCYFFRAGPILHGGPFMTSADLTAWGFGVHGLSLHANARVGTDLSSADVWPGTEPAVQLVEGYGEYAAERFTARLGRQIERGRLGYYGYDGGPARLSLPEARADRDRLCGSWIGEGQRPPRDQ
jgi:hypothetical protein